MIRYFVGVFLIFFLHISFGSELSTESPKNSIAFPGYSKNTTKEGFAIKRGVPVENIARKSYDPPPEFYRGPGTSSSSSSYNSNSNRDSVTAEYSSRPFAFPQDNNNYEQRGSNGNAWSNNPHQQQERKGQHDRISVEHYGTSTGHADYADVSNHHHGYGAHPYGPPKAIEYEYYAPTGNSHGYHEGGGEAIPVELYTRGYGGYGHAGEYATYGHHAGGPLDVGHSSGKNHGYDKALLAKSFLIPLASAAVLGIAAALASNPLLLQLGTVSSVGKRKKRQLDEVLTHSRVYRHYAHKRN